MKIWSHSQIDANGQEHIVVEVEPAEVVPAYCSTPEFWANGGMYVSFEVNHKRQQTEAYWMFLYRGAPQVGGHIHIWRDQIWTERMCLKYCEEEYGK